MGLKKWDFRKQKKKKIVFKNKPVYTNIMAHMDLTPSICPYNILQPFLFDKNISKVTSFLTDNNQQKKKSIRKSLG